MPKDDDRVKAYGTIDELNSALGVLGALIEDKALKQELEQIQQLLFDCGNDIATPEGPSVYRLKQESVDWLEERIDVYAQIPPEVSTFVLPGGCLAASMAHLVRTVARRAEREMITFQWTMPTNQVAIKFVNRLSDYFFALARLLNAKENYPETIYHNGQAVFHNDISKEDIAD